ncbi:MAG: primosomal protein N' [Bacillota bacterium]|nr:primosomal protein N' [Bacillota bacterium]
MRVLHVYIEYGKSGLDRPFSYLYDGRRDVQPLFRVLVPFHGQRLMGFVSEVLETNLGKAELEKQAGYLLSYIYEVIDSEPLLNEELSKLAEEISSHYLAPKVSVLQSMLPSSLRPAKSSLNGPKVAYEKWVRLLDSNEDGLTSDKQVELLRLISAHGEVLKKDCGSPSSLKKLVELGKVELFSKEKQRYVLREFEKEQPHELSIDQQRAYRQILDSEKEVVLLQGVTGSGKTEVYLHLSEHYLSQGKSVLMMVPEISLTPIMVEYFARRFGKKIAILHSGLTPAQKYDEYRKIAKGEAQIAVGARSAVFAPLDNIGLIILDEEHVESYKQDNVPTYHAREVAIMRARHFGAKVLLGSATPSLESKAKASKGSYEFVSLPKRINQKELPSTQIIDLTNRRNMPPGSEILSKPLIDKLKEKLSRGEQAVLLINRRGYSPYIGCHDCGYVYTCPNCHSFLSYHKADNMLKCHHCDYVAKYPDSCPECGSRKIARTGYGTERVIKKLGELLPEARVLRLDSDVGKVSSAVNDTLESFRHKEADILVGTQMVAKGHDFPDVTLVGIVQADLGLYSPSFRASENTFELITQAVGRAGRSAKTGEAIIQTYNPSNYAITLAAKQDYESFFKKEMETRRLNIMPPYAYLVVIRVESKDEEKAIEASHAIKQDLMNQKFKDVIVVGPSTPYIAFLAGKHRRNILVKYRTNAYLWPYLSDLAKTLSGRAGVEISFDVDPSDY